jgi:hypothetical protein
MSEPEIDPSVTPDQGPGETAEDDALRDVVRQRLHRLRPRSLTCHDDDPKTTGLGLRRDNGGRYKLDNVIHQFAVRNACHDPSVYILFVPLLELP